MTRGQRRIHRITWFVLTPILIVMLMVALSQRPGGGIQDGPSVRSAP